MKSTIRSLGLCGILAAATVPAIGQCPAFSSVSFMNYGTSCPPTFFCAPNLYGFYGSCSVSLALIGPSSTFVVVGIAAQPLATGAPVQLGGMNCLLWATQPILILDVTGQGLTQLTLNPPSFSLAGLTVYCQALYQVNCAGAAQFGLTDGLAVTFN